MQTKKWVRLGLLTVMVGGLVGGAALAGCSGDDNNGSSGGTDAGGDHTTSDSSSGGQDSSPAQDTGTKPDTGSSSGGNDAGPPPKVYLANAAVDPLAPPLRFCFGIAQSADGGGVAVPAAGIDAFPDAPVSAQFPIAGLFPGFGGSTSSSAQLSAFDLSTLTISLYAIDATHIANDTAAGAPDGGKEIPCEGLIGTDAQGTKGTGGGILTPGTDYWYAGTIPACTLSPTSCLAHRDTFVVAVTGCVPNETGAAAALCGPTYSATAGNLSLVAYELDTTTVIDAGIGAQFANASGQWDGVGTASGAAGTVAGFWTLTTPEAGTSEAGSDDAGDAAPADAGPPSPVFTPSIIAMPPNTAFPKITSPAVQVPFVGYDETSGFFSAYASATGTLVEVPPGCTPGVSCVSPTALPLPIIDEYTNGSAADGGTFALGNTVGFVLIGDPSGAELPYIGADGGQTTTPPDPNNPVPNGKFPHFLAFPSHNP
ncbi:MAG TPA: hypothetical protein VGG39_16205 [Polyangiaceae bacterium]|jgi:hypothetical protein